MDSKKSLAKDEVGNVYSRLTVISKAENSAQGDCRFNCLCKCGNISVVKGSHLRSGKTVSCGCSMIKEKLYYGHGLYAKGKYVTSNNGKLTKEFSVWVKMIERCYREESWKVNPTYEKCEVSKNFKNFQFFAEWCNNQEGFGRTGWELDKDIIGDGFLYSENTCCFVPKYINLFIADILMKPSSIYGLPRGVTKRNEKFRARLYVKGKLKTLGTFDTAEQAGKAYSKAKLEEFYRIIEENAYLPEKVVKSLWLMYESIKDKIL